MRLEDLPLRDRLLIHAYPWRAVRPVPCARIGKPRDAWRVGLVSTAGLVAPGEPPFDLAARGGDVSFRVIARELSPRELRFEHRSHAFDRTGVEQDRNVAFPVDRLREMTDEGRIGSVAPRHLSFMGSITAPGRLRHETAPQAAAIFAEDQVDVALLVPV